MTRPIDEILGFMRANRQIYREALPVFFSINTFWCEYSMSTRAFMQTLCMMDLLSKVPRPALYLSELLPIEFLTKLWLAYNPYDELAVHDPSEALVYLV